MTSKCPNFAVKPLNCGLWFHLRFNYFDITFMVKKRITRENMITINLVVILLIIIVAMIAIIIIIVDVTIMINITIRRELKYKKTTLEKTRLLYIRQIPVLRTAGRPYITPTQPSTRQYSSCPLISPMTRRQRASMRTIHCRRRIMKALCVWMDPLLVTI